MWTRENRGLYQRKGLRYRRSLKRLLRVGPYMFHGRRHLIQGIPSRMLAVAHLATCVPAQILGPHI